MPKRAKELSPVEIKRITTPGLHAVGGVAGLSLQVTPTGSRSWILRARIGGRRCEIGLGPYPDVTLATARDNARELADQIRHGRDPVSERREARAAARAARYTFGMAAEDWLTEKLKEIDGDKNRTRYRATIDIHAMPELGDKPVAGITMQDVLKVLRPVWDSKTETATKLRERLEKVFDYAAAHGHRTAPNPATWRGNLSAVLPSPGRISKPDHQPALAVNDAPAWWRALSKRDGTSTLALQLLALTAVRSGEVRGATWDEIDETAKVWTIPAGRMKMKVAHRVPLTEPMLDVLKQARALAGDNELVFPAPRGGTLSDMALSMTMRRMHESLLVKDERGWVDAKSGRPAVPHGLRSTFRSWCSERTDFPFDLCEAALAHQVGSAVSRAYDRSDRFERRRALMEAWSSYLLGSAPAAVR